MIMLCFQRYFHFFFLVLIQFQSYDYALKLCNIDVPGTQRIICCQNGLQKRMENRIRIFDFGRFVDFLI